MHKVMRVYIHEVIGCLGKNKKILDLNLIVAVHRHFLTFLRDWIAGMRLDHKQKLPWSNGPQGRPGLSRISIYSCSIGADWFRHWSQRVFAVRSLINLYGSFDFDQSSKCFVRSSISEVSYQNVFPDRISVKLCKHYHSFDLFPPCIISDVWLLPHLE